MFDKSGQHLTRLDETKLLDAAAVDLPFELKCRSTFDDVDDEDDDDDDALKFRLPTVDADPIEKDAPP